MLKAFFIPLYFYELRKIRQKGIIKNQRKSAAKENHSLGINQ